MNARLELQSAYVCTLSIEQTALSLCPLLNTVRKGGGTRACNLCAFCSQNWLKHNGDMSTVVSKWSEVLPDFFKNSPPSTWGVQIAPNG